MYLCCIPELLLYADQTYEKAKQEWALYRKKWYVKLGRQEEMVRVGETIEAACVCLGEMNEVWCVNSLL